MTDTPFEPQSLNILALFTNSNARYQVPSYQRHYRWQDEHVEKLWSDLMTSWEASPDRSYFLGSIITTKPEIQTRYVDVVDGQQRLTTLMILFCVIRDLYPNLNQGSEDEFAVTSNTIKDAIKSSQDGRERFRLQLNFLPGDTSKTDFEQNIIAEGATKNLKRPTKLEMNNDNPKCKFINSAVILRENLESIGQEQTEIFISYLFNNVQVIRIDCKDISFAIRLFQVINTRGLDLSGSDLIKSFLFGEIDRLNSKDKGLLERERKQFMHDWFKIEETASVCSTNAYNMLTLYLYYTCERTAKTSLFDDLKEAFVEELLNKKESTEIMGDIVKFVKNHKYRIFDAKDKVIFSLRYTPWENLWKSILLTAMHKNYPDIDELAKELRRFYYLHWMAGKTLPNIKQTSFNVIKGIKKDNPINDIVQILRTKTEKDQVVNTAISHLVSSDLAEQKWAKPLLLLLEYESTDDSKLSYIDWDKKLHLEHIFPQKAGSGWEHISEEVAKQHQYGAGNITLLSGPKNIKAGNKPFAEKMKAYKGRGLESNNSGITAFVITQNIFLDYEAKIYKEKWDKKAMEARKDWFLDGIAKLLDIEKELADYKPDS